MNAIQEAHQQGQAIWLDYMRRSLLKSGEFQRLIQQGISGVTSNPTIFEKAIVGSTDYDNAILTLAKNSKDIVAIYEALVIEDIQGAADMLRPVYDRSSGLHGYASLEVSPLLARDTDGTITEAKRLFSALDRPNIMIKVPATEQGIPAIRKLIGEGININVTLIFSLDMYRKVIDAYIAGLEDLSMKSGDVSKVASVASFFLSRIDSMVDSLLEERIHNGQEQFKKMPGKAAIASANRAYQLFKHSFESERFRALKAKGARVQRPLWASTGTKNPAYSDVMYVESLIGPDTVNTMPPATLNAFLDHGHVRNSIEIDSSEATQTLADLTSAGISLESVTSRLLSDGVKAFADSFEKLMAGIEEKKARLLAPEHIHPGVKIGPLIGEVETALADLKQRDIVPRMWRKDYTIWKPDPAEITDRLGWLSITDLMSEQIPALQSFAREMVGAGFRHVVLLGMGGSSLGSEVLRQTFGHAEGYPELIVLDSTIPAWIKSVEDSIDPARTLFIISSKSGTTTEPLILLSYFKAIVEASVGKQKAGRNFIAVTDPGTPLAKLAGEEGFRHIFTNPPDIGGRYSVLSYFGLVPAALAGINITALLQRSDLMKEACASCVPVDDNPGAWLGASLGTLTKQGRDKLTLITSPAISSFGLWVEQLIAESTGKEGKGIVPVAGEPLFEPEYYGSDRMFVYLRLQGDGNSSIDMAVENLRLSGQPVVALEIQDKYDLAAEFFRWEFATAVAGSVLGIHPFNQPDVQKAKDATERVLRLYDEAGRLPAAEVSNSLDSLLPEIGSGKYLAIMAYLRQTPELDQVLTAFRTRFTERHRIATTLGYGPRSLHSTGQLHKGGPDTGLFLQISSGHEQDLQIPGRPYTFGVVADAQALGDFETLQSLGKRVIRLVSGKGDAAAISELIGKIVPG